MTVDLKPDGAKLQSAIGQELKILAVFRGQEAANDNSYRNALLLFFYYCINELG